MAMTRVSQVLVFFPYLIEFLGMMSLINTNHSYLRTMQISKESPIVGIVVSVYYLDCAIGAVVASKFAGKKGRKASIFACLATTILGNLIMLVSGISMHGTSPWGGDALACMILGRVILGLGVG
jgi:MFS family permease